MITNLKITNCYSFNKTVEFSMKADMRTKKFNTNIYKNNNDINILKTAVIYGSNNTGKTAFINCIKIIKDVLSNKRTYIPSNLFENSNVCQMQVSFLYEENEYQFEYKYDSKLEEYIYEKFSKIEKSKEDIYYIKDAEQGKYKCPKDKKMEKILSIASKNNILIYTIETKEFPILENTKKILTNFANSIDVVYMNTFRNEKTIQLLKNKNNITKKVVDFIINADLYLDNYEYNDNVKFNIKMEDDKLTEIVNENLKKNQSFIEQMKLVSYYKGKPVPSMLFDSIGTKKIVALAGYIIEAIEQGKTLVVDEMDSSLHFKLTRAILGLFNNEKNKNGQLICALHDVSILDCKRLLRKDQIYFTAKDEKQTYLYSLKEFNSHEDGVRGDTSDILDKYEKGVFGAIPEPNLVSVLLEEEE